MFTRDIQPIIKRAATQFPVVALTGPRQSGKTTVLQYLFEQHEYINLENPSTLSKVSADPIGFFHAKDSKSWIIDEAQRFPELFSYLQEWSDELKAPGKFILSGSQNFLLLHTISQTLAGRSAVLELLPLAFHELCSVQEYTNKYNLYQYLYNGTYPRIYNDHVDVDLWYNSYISTYLERDVRDLINVKDITKFQKFLKLCAGRHGQLLNLNSIAQECGISQPTANEWMCVLESSYILYRLQPYHNNFNKRVVKTPKLYFYDSAIVCQLLGIESAEHLSLHPSLGAIFEGFVISEIYKFYLNQGKKPPIYFWRSHAGDEIDLLIEKGTNIIAIKIKSSQTFNHSLVKKLQKSSTVMESQLLQKILVFGGDDNFIYNNVKIYNWRQIFSLMQDIFSL